MFSTCIILPSESFSLPLSFFFSRSAFNRLATNIINSRKNVLEECHVRSSRRFIAKARSARTQIDIDKEEEDEKQVDATAVTSALCFREHGMHTPGAPMGLKSRASASYY